MKTFLSVSVWRFTAFVLTLHTCTASEYEYIRWKSDFVGHSYGKTPQCLEIPEDLKLCHTVGYHQMLLPNLLEHDTIAEVKQQAASWVPLVHKACHSGTQVFLCSLFAPVCLERPIYPCRWLCEAVRDSCSPIMESFGFPWPEMLTCSKFPEDDVCISMNNTNTTEMPTASEASVCPPCDNDMSVDGILEHMCASEFAIKAKIKEVRVANRDREVVLQKRTRPLKLGDLKKKDLRKLALVLKNGAHCPCQQLENVRNSYLVMGRKVGKQFLLTGIHKWDKSNKDFKKALKKLKSHKCPSLETVF